MDFLQSGTRKEERLLPPEMLKQVTLLRRSLASLSNPVAGMESLVAQLAKYPTNEAFARFDRVAVHLASSFKHAHRFGCNFGANSIARQRVICVTAPLLEQ